MTIVEWTQQNVPAQEWMGLNAKVLASTDSTRIGQTGRIVGETKNTIQLEATKGVLVLPKKEVVLEIDWKEKKYLLDAKNWCFRPEDRIKVWAKKKK